MNQTLRRRLSRLSDVLTRDFHPGWAGYVRRLATPLGSLSLAAGSAILCGLILSPRAFTVAGGLIAVAAMGVAWPWVAVRGMSGRLSFDRRRIREGDSVSVRLTIRNRAPWSVWGLLADFGNVDLASTSGTVGFENSVAVAVAPGRRITTVDRCVRLTGRGVFPGEPPRIASGFPLGSGRRRGRSRRPNP